MIGAGLTWLLVQHRKSVALPEVPRALSGLADTMRESFGETAETTRDAVRAGAGTAAETVRDGVVALTELAQSGASAVGRAAAKGVRRTRAAAAQTWEERPLTVGLSLLAAGVAAGMMLPKPKSEVIARAAKGLTDKVASTSEEWLDSARELVTSSARAVSREAKRQGLTPTNIGRKVKRVATAVAP